MANFAPTEDEQELAAERSRKFWGTAKIAIRQIIPHPSISQTLDQRNVQRLCEIFEKEGCHRLAAYNHITAVVSEHHLHDAVRAAQVDQDNRADQTAGDPYSYPQLHFARGQVQCLHGQHRLRAAEAHLPPCDQWWTVDVYLDDMSPDLYNWLVDEYSNERSLSDGEIYRRIRQYQREANAHFEARWVARLSENKARRLRALESRPRIRAAFDGLLAVPALLVHGMQIGSLPEVLAANCDEEICHALTELHRYWSSLVAYDFAKMLRIDVHTVSTLQLLAPGVSSTDRAAVKGLVRSGAVFANFSTAERASIWTEMKKARVIIPSLTTFFKDARFLKSCANCVKMLLTPSEELTTLRKALRAAFLLNEAGNSTRSVQTSDATFRPYSSPPGEAVELSYRQLWLYAMRHYAELSNASLKHHAAGTLGHPEEDSQVLHGLATLAKRLGFQTPQIEKLLQQSPDRLIARSALLQARPRDRFQFGDGELESLVEQIIECFSMAVPRPWQPAGYPSGREVRKMARCGYPEAQAQVRDRPFLFVDRLNDAEARNATKVTSLFVRWNFYKTFFGEVSVPARDDGTTRPDSIGMLSPVFVPSGAGGEDGGCEDGPLRGIVLDLAQSSDQDHDERELPQDERPLHSDCEASQPISTSMLLSSTRSPREPEMELGDLDIIIDENSRMIEDSRTQADDAVAAGGGACGADIPGGLELVIASAAERHQPLLEPVFPDEADLLERSGGESVTERGSPDDNRKAGLRSQSPADQVMEERTSTPGSQITDTPGGSRGSGNEITKTLHILEGHQPRSRAGGVARLTQDRTPTGYKARWKPYRRSQRPASARRSSVPPRRGSLERAIRGLLRARDSASEESPVQDLTDDHDLETPAQPHHERNEAMAIRPSQRHSASWMAEWAEIASGNPYASAYAGRPTQTETDSQRADPEAIPAPGVVGQINFPSLMVVDSVLQSLTSLASWDQEQSPRPQNASIQHTTAVSAREAETNPRDNDTHNISGWGNMPATTLAPAGSGTCEILFLAPDESGNWSHLVHKVAVSPMDPSPVTQIAVEESRERQAVFYDCHLHQLAPARCFDAAVADGTYTVFMTFGYELAVNEQTMASIGRALQHRNVSSQPIDRHFYLKYRGIGSEYALPPVDL